MFPLRLFSRRFLLIEMISDPSVVNIRGNSGIDAQTIAEHVTPAYDPYLGVTDHQRSATIALFVF